MGLEGGPPVLRPALLGDIHFAQDLDPAHHGAQERQIETAHRHHGAVDPVEDLEVVLARAHVNVGCATVDRLDDQVVDQANDGPLLGQFLDRDVVLLLTGLAEQVQFGQETLIFFGVIAAMDHFLNGQGVGLQRLNSQTGDEAQRAQSLGVHGIDHGHCHGPVVAGHRRNSIAPGNVAGNGGESIILDDHVLQVDDRRCVAGVSARGCFLQPLVNLAHGNQHLNR